MITLLGDMGAIWYENNSAKLAGRARLFEGNTKPNAGGIWQSIYNLAALKLGMLSNPFRGFGVAEKREKALSSRAWFVVAESCALSLVWPLPHSIALRNVLIAALLITLAFGADWQQAVRLIRGPARGLTALYASFTLWILVVALFISPFRGWSLGEISGQWFCGFVAVLIGVITAFQKDVRIGPTIVVAVLGVLAVQVLAVDLQGIWVVARTGAWSHMARLGGLTAGPGKASYLTNFLLSGLIAELSLRMEGRQGLSWASAWVWGLVFACVVSIYFEAMRNELFDVVVFVMFVGIIGYRIQARRAPRRALLVATGSLVAILTAIGVDLVLDPRWQTLWATIPVALDTTGHLAWLNGQRFSLPHLPNGQVVNPSNYLRVAWIKEGLKSVVADPWGVGYGRSAFGHALRLRFGKMATTTGLNNSLITIAIGTGVPGVILWLGWFASIGKLAVSQFSGARAFEARFLLLIVLAFGVRMGLDNEMQNYTLEQFLYFVGLLAPLAVISRGTGEQSG